MELGRLGAGLARVPAHDTARGALRHGAGPCDTASWAATIRRWARGRLSGRACWAIRRWRWGAGGCAWGERHYSCDTAMLACDTTGPLPRHGRGHSHDTAGDTATIRQPCGFLGAPVRTWACLLGLLGDCASGLAFWTVFRLDYIFESPFGPGS